MGKEHCRNIKNANAFIKGLRKRGKSFINTNIRKRKNKDGSYIVIWKVKYI